jgi:hypothetical protein
MKKILFLYCFLAFVGLTSCEVEEVPNPNAPTIESFEDGATLADLILLANGLQAVIREDMAFHFWTTNMVGREYYDLRGTDPRYTGELLGRNGGDLDDQGFLTTRTYFGRYRSVRNANLLKTAVANTSASLTASQENSFLGLANTITGYELLLEATRQYENGIRLDVNDPDNLGPFTNSFDESLAGIRAILDEGFAQLSSADGLAFPLKGFNTISSSSVEALSQFNRAIAARTALYSEKDDEVLSLLEESFLDLDGDLDAGAYYTFGGPTGNDAANPLFYVPGVDNYMAHPSFAAEAEEGDNRLSKVTDTGEPISIDGLTSQFQVALYESNSSPAIMIRNEELILMYAEANIGRDNEEAVRAINIIRNAAGLDDYAGDTSEDALVDELLMQRRYSLFGEGHRWIDLRRYDRLDELPLDREGDKVHVQFPRPASEI